MLTANEKFGLRTELCMVGTRLKKFGEAVEIGDEYLIDIRGEALFSSMEGLKKQVCEIKAKGGL
jgi:hypothetical protein